MADDPVEVLKRWEDGGAEWRIESLTDDHAVVMMYTCTGEPVERLESDDDGLLKFLRERE
jgi:hypothetical protein